MDEINPDIRREKRTVLLLCFSLMIMLISFVIINLFFILVLHITWDYFIAIFWVLSVIPILFYFYYFQKKKLLSFSDIGLKKSNLGKNILFGICAGILTGLVGWIFLSLFGPPVEQLPTDFIILFIVASVISAPIREEIMFRGLLWAFFDKSLTLILKTKNNTVNIVRKDILIIIIITGTFLIVHTGRNVELLLTKFLFDSFVFSIVYYKSKSLLVPILAHSISNLFVLFRQIIG